jgi:hypothetical protein
MLPLVVSLCGLMDVSPDVAAPRRPWTDRWIVDVNVSPPQKRLNGDATAGYNGDRFGFLARAESTYYELDQPKSSALTERYAGNVDAWGLVDVHPFVRLEPRLSAGAAYYGTLADDATTTIARQTNQDSIFARGVGSLGVRVHPGSRFALAASFGAGYQYEDYFRVAQSAAGEQSTVFDAASTLRWEGRLRAQVAVVPGIVSFRARGDVNSFSMHRSDLAVTYSIGRAASATSTTEIAQTEIFARGFVDLDVVRFFDFVPAVHAGANVFVLSSPNESTSAVTPVFGIGIRREAL